MTRQLAQDSLRYVIYDYDDEVAQCRKMIRKHGDLWHPAVVHAWAIWRDHGDRECYAVLLDMVHRAIDPTVQ